MFTPSGVSFSRILCPAGVSCNAIILYSPTAICSPFFKSRRQTTTVSLGFILKNAACSIKIKVFCFLISLNYYFIGAKITIFSLRPKKNQVKDNIVYLLTLTVLFIVELKFITHLAFHFSVFF